METMEHIDYQFSHVEKLAQAGKWSDLSEWAGRELLVCGYRPELLISLLTALFPVKSKFLLYPWVFTHVKYMLPGDGSKILKGLEP